MTMQHSIHPDDERLAALAGGDPEATGDGRLAEHVAGCDRCAPFVRELELVRTSLAELPDLRPHRPIQLLPPVPARGAAEGVVAGWIRRLAAPAMAAGAGLALVGAVGLGAMGLGGMAAGGAAVFQNVGDNLTTDEGEMAPGAEATSAPGERSDGSNEETFAERSALDLSTPLPWLIALVGGAVVFLLALVLRFVVVPRAG
jgi:hypothetical protein